MAKEYIAAGEQSKALTAVRDLTQALLQDHETCKARGDLQTAAELKSNFAFYLKSCLPAEDSPMAEEPIFMECLKLLENGA